LSEEEVMVRVEQWAEIRRLYYVKRLSIKEIARRTRRDRNTIRKALRSERPPKYSRPARPSKLDPSRRRSTGCSAPSRGCPASAFAS
jgi:transposase